MFHHHDKPEKHGSSASAHAPQVAVRDGGHLLCPCCGQVLIVLSEEPLNPNKPKMFSFPKMHKVKGDPRRTWPSLERLIAKQEAEERGEHKAAKVEEVPQQEPLKFKPDPNQPGYRADPLVVPIAPEIAAHEFPEVNPPKIPKPVKPVEHRTPSLEYRPKPTRDWNTRRRETELRRSKKPLSDPFTYEGARIFAWMYYRMKKLDLQLHGEIWAKQAEIDALEAELDGAKEEPAREERPQVEKPSMIRRVPRGRLRAYAKQAAARRQERVLHSVRGHADVSLAPEMVPSGANQTADQANERGPP